MNAEQPPLLLIKGGATDAEVAALVVVLSVAAASAVAEPSGKLRSAWADPTRLARSTLRHGAGAWRRSALP